MLAQHGKRIVASVGERYWVDGTLGVAGSSKGISASESGSVMSVEVESG